MEVIRTDIEGVFILQPRVFGDERGYFFESFSQRDFENQVCKTIFDRTMNRNHVMAY